MRRATAVAALGVASIAAVEPYTGSRAGQPAAAGGDSQREAYTGPRPPPASTTAMGAIAGCSRRAARLGSPAARRQSSAVGGVPAAAAADAAVGRILRGRHQAAAFRAGVHRAPPPPLPAWPRQRKTSSMCARRLRSAAPAPTGVPRNLVAGRQCHASTAGSGCAHTAALVLGLLSTGSFDCPLYSDVRSRFPTCLPGAAAWHAGASAACAQCSRAATSMPGQPLEIGERLARRAFIVISPTTGSAWKFKGPSLSCKRHVGGSDGCAPRSPARAAEQSLSSF